MIPNDISGSRLPARNWGFMKAHEGWRVAKPKARKWDSKDKGGKDKQKVRKYMKVKYGMNGKNKSSSLCFLKTLRWAAAPVWSSLRTCACKKASKTYSTRQHQTAPDSTWQHLTAPEIPEIVFFDSASWHRSWHRSWMVDVRCKDHEVRCRRCLATLIVQKGCDRSEEFRTVKEISWYHVISMRVSHCSHVHVRHGVNFDERWTTQVISARFAEKAEHQHQS